MHQQSTVLVLGNRTACRNVAYLRTASSLGNCLPCFIHLFSVLMLQRNVNGSLLLLISDRRVFYFFIRRQLTFCARQKFLFSSLGYRCCNHGIVSLAVGSSCEGCVVSLDFVVYPAKHRSRLFESYLLHRRSNTSSCAPPLQPP